MKCFICKKEIGDKRPSNYPGTGGPYRTYERKFDLDLPMFQNKKIVCHKECDDKLKGV